MNDVYLTLEKPLETPISQYSFFFSVTLIVSLRVFTVTISRNDASTWHLPHRWEESSSVVWENLVGAFCHIRGEVDCAL